MSDDPRFSVVIPTHQRRSLVIAAVLSLAQQDFAGSHEVIVVVDGSTDGSAEALRALRVPFRLAVVEQANAGAARARNVGAARALGQVLVFMDDDMEADMGLLTEHDRLQRGGWSVVSGHMALHPESTGFLSTAVGSWSDDRLKRLSALEAPLDFGEILTGQVSIERGLFNAIGGFDEQFTRGGTYGNEDLDFGARLLEHGARATFAPRAVSRQRYVVTPRHHLRQWRDTGRADVGFARKHPKAGALLFGARGRGRRSYRLLWAHVAHRPVLGRALAALARPPVLRMTERAAFSNTRFRAFRFVRGLEYWRGVGEAGGVPEAEEVTVLAYHAIADVVDPVLRPYGVPARAFARQLDVLIRTGHRFVTPTEVLTLLSGGGGVPRRSVLITFDDCYADLRSAAVPVLRRHGVAALAFAVSGLVGSSNRWDERAGRRSIPLLDAAGLADLQAAGVEVGAHSRSHPRLPELGEEALADEVMGAVDDLTAMGLPRPRFYAYPYGEVDDRVAAAVRDAGVAAAFTVEPGRVTRTSDPHRLPRVEILAGDGRLRLLWKLRRPVRSRRLPRR